jgi:PilZ domain
MSVPHRRAFRHEAPIPCQIVRERDFRLVAEAAIDLSTAGMRAVSRLPVLTGEPVLVSFRAPRSGAWFDLEATVARVEHGRRPGDDGRCLGLAFHGTSDAARHALFSALSALPPTRARRGGHVSRATSRRQDRHATTCTVAP